MAELALDHTERVFDLGPDAGLKAFELVGQPVDRASLVQQLALAWAHGDVPAHAMASYFAAANRNKRTVCVDVSEPEGRGVVMRMLQDANVLIENFKIGTLERGTGIPGAHLRGAHLRLPGHGAEGPTLEIFNFNVLEERPDVAVNRPGFGHIAFIVDDVAAARKTVLAAGDCLSEKSTRSPMRPEYG